MVWTAEDSLKMRSVKAQIKVTSEKKQLMQHCIVFGGLAWFFSPLTKALISHRIFF